MPLQVIAEDDVVDSFDTINLNTRTRPLGHRTVRRTLTDDNSSISSYSTNATAPNLPGPGRVLGNFYDYSGRYLERALGDIARIAGFGPEAVYKKIRVLSQGDWTKDDKQASLLQKHCLKLFEHVNSREYLTRLQAIKRWGDILQHHHEIYLWFCYNRSTEVMTNVDELTSNVEAFREEVKSPFDMQILNGTAQLIVCHSVGLRLLNLSRGTIRMVGPIFKVDWQDLRKFSKDDVEKWGILFQYLLDSTLTASLSNISRWYIQLWSTQIENRKLHGQIALQACHTLRNMLTAESQLHTVRLGLIQSLCENIYAYLTQFLDFGAPLMPTEGNDRELHDSVTMHFSIAVTTLNNLVRSYNSVMPESSLLLLPGCLKEKIRPLLTTAGNGQPTEESETILVQIFNRLLDHALFEIKDGACLAELSDCVSFDDESTRSLALLQLGDILQSISEVDVIIALGGHATHDRLLEINKSLEKSQLTESKCGIFTDLHPILKCHTLAYEFRRVLIPIQGKSHMEGKSVQAEWKDSLNYPRSEIERWDISIQYLLESLLNPAISQISQRYLSVWSSQLIEGTPHVHNVLLCCRSLQNAFRLVDISQVSRWDALQIFCKAVYTNLVRRFDSNTLLLHEGAQISITLNGLTQLHDSVFSPKLGSVPNLACLTMLGSTDLISAGIKEEIRGSLKNLQDDDNDEGLKKKVTKSMLLQSCKSLLKRAQVAISEMEILNVSNDTSIRALFKLKDILQSLPEVYMLLITLGGDEIRDSVEALHNIKCKFGDIYCVLEPLQRLVACHSAGMWLASEIMSNVWSSEVNKFIAQTVSFDNRDFDKVRSQFLWYLMVDFTAIPFNFYINYGRANYNCYPKQLFLPCSIVQGALLKDGSRVLQETRSAMEESCRLMQSSIIEQLRCSVEHFSGDLPELGHAMQSVYSDLIFSERHPQAFADEAEVYLSQLCILLFDMIAKAGRKSFEHMAIKEFFNLFEYWNVIGWFLSIRGPDAEQSISRFLEVTDGSRVYDPKKVRYYKLPFSHLEVHKLGVELLAPRHEKLHFDGAGLTKHLSTRSSEPPLTPEQKERWINAFITLAVNLTSSVSDLKVISLFYFANCPFPYEADPVLDTAIALDYCAILQRTMPEYGLWFGSSKEALSRIVCHIHTCLTKRVEFVQQSCTDLVPDEAPTFYGTSFDTPKVVKVLNDLAKLSKEELGSHAPELLTIPDY